MEIVLDIINPKAYLMLTIIGVSVTINIVSHKKKKR
jgi:hypothetical protein